MPGVLQSTSAGLYCPAGDFYLDPWQAVDRAIITHAHSDHAQPGSREYLTAEPGAAVLRDRLGSEAAIQSLRFGETIEHRGVKISLHPAGHILGSCQVRLEAGGERWVFSGDYKRAADPTCAPFEPLQCDTFITESTFGLPIYRWRPPEEILSDINAWWLANQGRNRTSVIYAYSLGKSQRILAGVDSSPGPILVHGAVERYLNLYRNAGVQLPAVERVNSQNSRLHRGRALVVAPPSATNTPWLRKLGPISTAIASGWMQIRGARRRRAVDRGFALSDHADWDDLLKTIRETGAEHVGVTHGYTGVMVRWLNENGWRASTIATPYHGELEVEQEAAAEQEAESIDNATT